MSESNILGSSYALVPIDDIAPHPKNPRKGNVEAILASIDAHGFYGAVLVQRATSRIVAGAHRWRAAKQKGFERIPVIWLDVDDGEAERIMLADNRVSDLAVWDDQALCEILKDLHDNGGLDGTAFTDIEFERMLSSLAVPDFEPGGVEGQGRLDELSKVTCPECGHEFAPGLVYS